MTDPQRPAEPAADVPTIGRIIRSVESSAGINALLWLGSVAVWIVAVAWVIFAGPAGSVDLRAAAVARLWPVVAAWVFGLVCKSHITARQKRELIASYSVLESARLTAVAGFASREPPPSAVGRHPYPGGPTDAQ